MFISQLELFSRMIFVAVTSPQYGAGKYGRRSPSRVSLKVRAFESSEALKKVMETSSNRYGAPDRRLWLLIERILTFGGILLLGPA